MCEIFFFKLWLDITDVEFSPYKRRASIILQNKITFLCHA